MGHDHWIPKDEWPQLIQRVRMAQADMEEPARSRFSEKTLDHLRALIRLTIEFHHYLQSQRSAHPDRENLIRNYVCESVFAGTESFQFVSDDFRGLVGAARTNVGWGSSIISASSFKEKFFTMFEEFSAETNFENKCRTLFDLF